MTVLMGVKVMSWKGGRGDWMSLMYTCTYLVRLKESVSEQKNGVGLKLQVQYKLQ